MRILSAAQVFDQGYYHQFPNRRPLLPSEEKTKAQKEMIRKGRNTIAQKQAFLRSTSKQKKVLWRHSPLNPNRISVE